MMRPMSVVSTVAAPWPLCKPSTAWVDMRLIRSRRVAPVRWSIPRAGCSASTAAAWAAA